MLNLTAVIANLPHTHALLDGTVKPDGIDLTFLQPDRGGDLHNPGINAWRSMVRDLEYDLIQLPLTTYISALEYGLPITAIPVFPAIDLQPFVPMVNSETGIKEPKELEGHRCGVRGYGVTAAVWGRGLLSDFYGVDLDSMSWVTVEEEHVTAFKLPDNVEYVAGGDLGVLISTGELAGGIGFNRATALYDNIVDLVDDRAAVGAEWVTKKGIWVINHVIAIKQSLVEEHPGIAGSLFEAFDAAKQSFLTKLASGADLTAEEAAIAGRRELLGADPIPYGEGPNERTLQAIIRFCKEQRILTRDLSVGDLFAS